ncbi:hypothetical protein PINS_up009900 [Pythium insidiosum]|nr:hypothetical protein PINS_up009900 [Pythium insidiosum]
MSSAIEQRNQDATVYVGNLDDRVTEELLWELMVQAGSVINVHMPTDKITTRHQNYGFVEFRTEECADYAVKILNMIQLFGKVIRVKKASQDRKSLDIGANLFIGNLDHEVDEKLLYDTFSAFGGIIETPKIMRDPDTKASRGFGFISYDSFEAADLAIECMHGQYLCNRQIVVQYAFKKDSKGERHGSEAERLLAQSNPNRLKPHTRFGGDSYVTAAYGQRWRDGATAAAARDGNGHGHEYGNGHEYGRGHGHGACDGRRRSTATSAASSDDGDDAASDVVHGDGNERRRATATAAAACTLRLIPYTR